jgi:DNA-binding response OmpR family regulator
VPTILVVDDDALVRRVLGEALRLQWPDVTVLTTADGDEALQVLLAQPPDLVLLDIELPGRSGFEVLREIRQISDVPVIILTPRDNEYDQVRGLQLGADGYVVKADGIVVLTARIRAVLRRVQRLRGARGTSDLVVGSLTLSPRTRQVAIHGRPVSLTPVEFPLLYHLAANAGRVLPYETLTTRIWGPDATRTVAHLRVLVSRVQAKLEQAGGPHCIENERGLGYRLVPPFPIAHQPSAED